MKKQFTTAAVAITLAVIPLTAVAAYMAQSVEGKPIITELFGEDSITGEFKIVATKIQPQTKLDNLLTDVKNGLVLPKKEVVNLTKEELQRRQDAGKEYMRKLEIAKADGEITFIERLAIVAGL
jgi:hypothetical protein